jgi:alkanesulfonate monooxygenase SsuD/methylene tetrahydromethanopterin reductase-like flavin-dependent oxidoreductase (luciferase family)
MQFGFVLPRGDARTAADFAHAAEAAGWDGFFVWEPVYGVDAWVALTAAAMRTERIRLGTLLSPVSRMRPWKLASEAATLDNLSGGRVIISVGLGALDTGFGAVGEVTDRKARAALLDEGLAIMEGLWQGLPFSFEGEHYQIKELAFMAPAPPVQQPRIPIWVVGAWPRPKSMKRAIRWDGLLPAKMTDSGEFTELVPDDIRAIKAYIDEHRTQTTPFDIIVEGTTPGDNPATAAETIRGWVDVGATWWIESMWETPEPDAVLARIQQGPPRLGNRDAG